MSRLALELAFIFILLLMNGLFAMSEIAIVSSRKAKLQSLAKHGDERAQRALELSTSPGQFLSTVQVGITAVGILSGAVGSGTIAVKLGEFFKDIPWLQKYGDALGLGIVVISITYLSLIFGELVPKYIALQDPEGIARIVARPMQQLARIAHPFVRLLSKTAEFIIKHLGFKHKNLDSIDVTEDEIKTLVQQGSEVGAIDHSEREMVENVLSFGDRQASMLMTPRPDIVWLDLNAPHEVNADKLKLSQYSYFPVAKSSLEHVIGILHVKDILAQQLGHGAHDNLDLSASLSQPLFVPEFTKAAKILELFKQTGIHIALVVDEYGMVQGLVTLNDILEEIVGDLPPVPTEQTQQAIKREDGSWLVDGLITIDDFKKTLNVSHLPGEEQKNFNTLAGFIVSQIGRIPSAADYIDCDNGMRLEIVDMDGNRIDKVLATFHNG